MSFTLLPGLAPFAIALVVLAALTVVVAGSVLIAEVSRNRVVRVRRHETVRQYYGHLALGH
jgi:uncharacterized integral membrane protein